VLVGFCLCQPAALVGVVWFLFAGVLLVGGGPGGAPPPRWTYAVGSLTGALLWPLVTALLQWPQRPQRSPAER
jgi:cell shape-determining protein MreD